MKIPSTLLFVLWLTAHVSCAQMFELPQFRPRYADEVEMTEASVLKEVEEGFAWLDKNSQEHPELAAEYKVTKFNRLYHAFSNTYNTKANDGAYQTAQIHIINAHPEWKQMILEHCLEDPFWKRRGEDGRLKGSGYWQAVDVLPHHQACTWEESRGAYRVLLAQYRLAHQYLARVHLLENFYNWDVTEDQRQGGYPNPGKSGMSHELCNLLGTVAGVIARFPTAEGVEELCLQLEDPVGGWTLAAANALSVCTTEETAPRVRRAFEAAKIIRKEKQRDLGGEEWWFPLEYHRLESHLADLKADLTAMPEGAAFRFIKPDWSAMKDTTWNQIPPMATSSAAAIKTPLVAASPVVMSQDSTPTPRWLWLLLVLVPGAWFAGKAWERRKAGGS